MKTGIIYKHTNKINGKAYIGVTICSLKIRKQKGYKSHFGQALKKYGWEGFETSLLEDNVPEIMLSEREQYWIKYFNTFKNGYNSTDGGKNGYQYCPTTRHKIALALSIPVKRYSLDGLLIKEYKSMSDAARELNTDPSMISAVANRKYGRKTHLNSVWRFVNDMDTSLEYNKADYSDKFKPILQIKDEIIICEHKSFNKACEVTKINRGSIYKALNNQLKTAGGFKWRYKNGK
jgi:hypothetical protein